MKTVAYLLVMSSLTLPVWGALGPDSTANPKPKSVVQPATSKATTSASVSSLNQVRLLIDNCTGTYQVIWPADLGKPTVRKRPYLKKHETITVEVTGINPHYYEDLEVNGTSIALQTEEPKNFLSPVTAKAATPDAADLLAGLNINGAMGHGAMMVMADMRPTTTWALARQVARLQRLTALQRNMERFAKLQTETPCFAAGQFVQQREQIRQSVIDFFGTEVDVDNADSLTNAFKREHALLVSLYKEADGQLKAQEHEVDSVERQGPPTGRGIRPAQSQQYYEELLASRKAVDQDRQALAEYKRDAERFKTLSADENRQLNELVHSFVAGQRLVSTIPAWIPLPSPKEDAEQYSVEVKGIRTDPKDAKKTIEQLLFDKTFPIVGGFQIAFSAGGAFSGLTDHAFTVRIDSTAQGTTANGKTAAAATDRSYTIKRETGRIGFLLSTNVHALWRITPGFSAGFHAGAGVDILNDQRARYMAGATVRFGGALDNFLLHGGVVTGKVKRISQTYEVNKPYKQSVDPKTIDTFQSSWYVGFSYILGRNKTKKTN